MAFATRCGARRLVLTHHAPGRTDAELDGLAGGLGTGITVAIQGTVMDVR